MGRNTVGLVDPSTGELLGGALVYFADRPRFKEAFVMLWQEALPRLVRDKRLGLQHWRVLMWLMSKLDFENYIHVAQIDIAKGTEMDKGNISRVMRDLLEFGVVLEGPRIGRSTTYRMSPNLGWRGRVKSFQEERSRRLALVHSSTPDRGGKASHRRS